MNRTYVFMAVALAAAVLAPPAAASDYTVGVYISGYGGEYWNNGNVWSARGIPQAWDQEGVFDLSINLDEELFDLFDGASGQRLAEILDDEDVRTRVVSNIVYDVGTFLVQNYRVGMEIDLVFVGHGAAGGFLARKLGSDAATLGLDEITFNGTTLASVETTVITAATPHQGLRIAEAAYGTRSGHRNVYPTLNRFASDLLAGPEAGYSWTTGLTSFFLRIKATLDATVASIGSLPLNITGDNWLGETVSVWNNSFGGSQYVQFTEGMELVSTELPVYLNEALDQTRDALEARNSVEGALNYGLRDLVGPGGDVPSHLNALPNPDNYRSIMGAEKAATPIRLGAELVTNPGNWSVNVEEGFYDQYDDFRYFARVQLDHWRWTPCFYPAACARVNEREDAWLGVRTALDNVDRTWGSVIGSSRYETRTGYRYVYDPLTCGQGTGGPDEQLIRIDAMFRPSVSDCEPNSSYRRVSYQYTVTIPLKNDGVFSPHYGRWSAGDGADDGVHNVTYDDLSSDGGYNHLEVVRHRRENSDAKPMEETKQWLMSDVF